MFEIEQLENSRVALKAPNGKYITIKMTGALNASVDTCGDKEKFLVSFLEARRISISRCLYFRATLTIIWVDGPRVIKEIFVSYQDMARLCGLGP